ncbi:MAG: metallophosphoesterase [Myxococcales bacterium]|nr:metallophosphoesterase [Myxococcales bacterium]
MTAPPSSTDASPETIAVFGGVYNNYLSLQAVIDDARAQGAQRIYCLGDIGGFGPHPDRSVPILQREGVLTMQGNYDHSIGNELEDCACGYTDPRDNHFAQISYDYTLGHTSDAHKAWLRDLPTEFRLEFGGHRLLMAHGSPRRVNEFLWASTTPRPFIRRLLDEHEADLLLVTHTGIHWSRFLEEEPTRGVVNVGAIGRPANDGRTEVWYALLTAPERPGLPIDVTFRPIAYDHARLAADMRAEALPEEFVETILTGWWTTCLEILPIKERSRSRY